MDARTSARVHVRPLAHVLHLPGLNPVQPPERHTQMATCVGASVHTPLGSWAANESPRACIAPAPNLRRSDANSGSTKPALADGSKIRFGCSSGT